MLLTVLNEILDMSKIEAGKMELETIPFVPSEIVNNIEALHRLRAEEKGIEFEVLTSKGADLVWMGDQFRIQQILNNLLSNAIKFTESGTVSLSMSIREGKPLVIEVRDTGIGMTPAEIDRVFISFEQAEGGTTRRFGGTGLGMAIVRSLIDLMAGEITIESAPDRGTTMRVSIPLSLADSKNGVSQQETVVPPSAIPLLTGIRLLVADDSPINLQVLQAMLKNTQAQLTMVTNGAEAVEEWKRMRSSGQPADMLILDISMPVLDGVGALVNIRMLEGDGLQVPAIAVTANAMSHQVTEYILAGFNAHVPKPYRQSTLLNAISTLLLQVENNKT
jgi:CheY-like chemotaxis protein/anti-sigma regulatory factor (Ser/Thr protein kinase)